MAEQARRRAGSRVDVLASNRLGDALSSHFTHPPDLVTRMFVDPAARQFYADWDRAANGSVAGFRFLHGRAPQRPRIVEVLTSVNAASPEFRHLWQGHDARGKRLEVKIFRHAVVGEPTVRIHAFDVRSAPRQELVVYHAEGGSRSADALKLLGTMAARADGESATSSEIS